MGSKVMSGSNCEKQLGSGNCQKKDCRVRSECENGALRRTPSNHSKNSKENNFRYRYRWYF